MKLGRAIVLSAAFGVAVYIAIAAYTGWGKVAAELAHFSWAAAGAGFALAAANYLLRFGKWELYLRRLGVRIPLFDSLRIFLSGFSLTVTPGKVGEVLKAYLLRETHGVPMARTAPTVVAERATDLLALVALALVGVQALGGNTRVLWAAVALVGLLVALASSRRLVHAIIDVAAKLSLFAKLAPKLREFYDATAVLLAPAPLLAATALSVAAWACECLAFWVVLHGFGGDIQASLKLCTFIYAAMTIAGALSFLPGGLGVQESGMVALLVSTAHGVGTATAAAATFITRLCTLWFAVAVGLVALTLLQRRARVDLAAVRAAE
jgi:glycosyltransferase 2 family protein